MPKAPKKYSPRGHQPNQRHNWGCDKQRGNRHERGYGDDWYRLRAAYVAEHPNCERCEENGRIVPTDEVHHKVAFKGKDDPLRLEWDNLQALCGDCHKRATMARRGSKG